MKKLMVMLAAVGLLFMACEKGALDQAANPDPNPNPNPAPVPPVATWTLEIKTYTGVNTDRTFDSTGAYTYKTSQSDSVTKRTMTDKEIALFKMVIDNAKLLNDKTPSGVVCTADVEYSIKYTENGVSKENSFNSCNASKGVELVIYQVNEFANKPQPVCSAGGQPC